MKTKKNANDVHLQRQRIVASLNLYLRIASVLVKSASASMRRRCVYRPTCEMRYSLPKTSLPTSFMSAAQEPPPQCHGLIASNYPVPFIVGHCADSLDTVTVSSSTSTMHPNTASADLADHLPYS